jgi:aminoglycoside phosphotransferase
MEERQKTKEPNIQLAFEIAESVTGCAPVTVERFRTGARHYVFDVEFPDREPVVVRIGDQSSHSEMAGAIHLSGLLRPRGVPLPAILAADVQAERPWLLMERLLGTDLGAVIAGVTDQKLDRIAAAVARAQERTGELGQGRGYGYTIRPEQAPHAAWSQVVEANLARSRRRMASTRLFEVDLVDRVQAALNELREKVDGIAATPFLHDTTTKNVIVTSKGEFSGIVDVDDLCFGDPRYPAALTLAALMVYGGPVQYVSAWLHHAGRPDDQVFRLYVAVFVLDLMAEHGQVFNGNERASSLDDRTALRRAFESSFMHLRT